MTKTTHTHTNIHTYMHNVQYIDINRQCWVLCCSAGLPLLEINVAFLLMGNMSLFSEAFSFFMRVFLNSVDLYHRTWLYSHFLWYLPQVLINFWPWCQPSRTDWYLPFQFLWYFTVFQMIYVRAEKVRVGLKESRGWQLGQDGSGEIRARI